MRARFATIIGSAFVAASAAAQVPRMTATDSAQIARAAWGRAVAALRADDLDAAYREVDAAAQAWPTQQAYQWGRAVVAARRADTAALFGALAAYAELGLGRDLRHDSIFARYLTMPSFTRLAARHDANREVLTRSAVRLTLPDSTFWPEGVDYDPRTACFYLTSIRHRTIAEACPGRRPRELWARRTPGIGAVFAVRVDTARGVLWATMSGLPQMDGYEKGDSTLAALLRIRIADGRLEQRWDLAAVPNGHTLGDVAVAPNGDVLVSDSNEPTLYRLRSGSDSLERIRSPLFRSLQGIAPSSDGRAVYVADYSHGLLRLDLGSGRTTRLAELPKTTTLGIDGILFDRGSIIAIQNGVQPARVMRFVLDVTGDRIVRAELLDRNSTLADEPTIGTLAGRAFVYVANSQWDKYTGDGARRPGTRLTPPVLLSLDLESRR